MTLNFSYFETLVTSQPVFTCSKLTIETRGKICSKLTIKIPERCHWRLYSGIFIVNFEHVTAAWVTENKFTLQTPFLKIHSKGSC